jgi:hypothetical protein
MKHWIFIAAAVICVGCSNQCAPAPTAAVKPVHEDPVITRMVSRDQTIIVRAGKNGATYSVESPDGSVLLASVTLDQLRVQNPDLAKRLETLHAATLWAGADTN